jgi:hypothetical protein
MLATLTRIHMAILTLHSDHYDDIDDLIASVESEFNPKNSIANPKFLINFCKTAFYGFI